MANPTNKAAQQTASTNSSRAGIYIGIVSIAAVIILILFLMNQFSRSQHSTVTVGSTTIPASAPLTPKSNAAPVYMSVPDAEKLLGSNIVNFSDNYSSTSLYNASAPVNVSLMTSLVPQLAGNITNGWITVTFGSNTVQNASLQYFVMQTNNASKMASFMSEAVAATIPALPNIVSGHYNGLNYTYESYSDSLNGSIQALTGWKNGYIALVFLQANNFTTNQSTIAHVVSNNLP